MVCGEGNLQKPEPPWSVGDTDGAFHTFSPTTGLTKYLIDRVKTLLQLMIVAVANCCRRGLSGTRNSNQLITSLNRGPKFYFDSHLRLLPWRSLYGRSKKTKHSWNVTRSTYLIPRPPEKPIFFWL